MRTILVRGARAALVALAALAAPGAAHEIIGLGPKGGQMLHWGMSHFELAPGPRGTMLYVYGATDANPPVKTGGATATGQVVVGGKVVPAVFKPAGGNAMSAPGLRLVGDWVVALTVRVPGRQGAQVRFSNKAMRAQAAALRAR